MSVSEAVLSYLRVLIWPALICVLAFGFRSTLRSLLRVRLRQIDAAGFSAKFEEVAQEAERVVEAGQPPGTSLPKRPVSERDLVHVRPENFNDARVIGEAFRDGKPVVIDLNRMDEDDAKRLVDFSAGLIFMGRGALDRVTSMVFMLTPEAFLDHENSGARDGAPPSAKEPRAPAQPTQP
jgi:hypothetical protein